MSGLTQELVCYQSSISNPYMMPMGFWFFLLFGIKHSIWAGKESFCFSPCILLWKISSTQKSWKQLLSVYFFFVVVVLGVELRPSHVLAKGSATDPCGQPCDLCTFIFSEPGLHAGHLSRSITPHPPAAPRGVFYFQHWGLNPGALYWAVGQVISYLGPKTQQQ